MPVVRSKTVSNTVAPSQLRTLAHLLEDLVDVDLEGLDLGLALLLATGLCGLGDLLGGLLLCLGSHGCLAGLL